MNRRILVIGSNSFCGSSFIANALNLNYEVIGVSRSGEKNKLFLPYKWQTCKSLANRFSFFRLDINKDAKELIEIADSFRPQYIINYAGQGMVEESWGSPLDWYETNLISQIALIEQLRQKDYLERYIHFTTPEVYGNTGNDWITEEHPYNPSTPYAISKAGLDSMVRAWSSEMKETKLKINLYDPGATRTQMREKAYPGENPDTLKHPNKVGEEILKICEEGFNNNGERLKYPNF